MAEYLDRKKYMKDKYNCDLIQIDNAELVPLYQIIDKLEQSIERSKIDKTIGEIKELYTEWENITNDARLESNPFGAVLNIIQRNIGE